MEPTHLNTPANEDDGLAGLLRAATPVLPDNGFSFRVLAALPPSESKSKLRWRIAACLGGAVAGCGFAFWLVTTGAELRSALTQFAADLVGAGPIFINPMVAGALVVAALSLLFAFRMQLRDQLTT